jgi:hypothetical protein
VNICASLMGFRLALAWHCAKAGQDRASIRGLFYKEALNGDTQFTTDVSFNNQEGAYEMNAIKLPRFTGDASLYRTTTNHKSTLIPASVSGTSGGSGYPGRTVTEAPECLNRTTNCRNSYGVLGISLTCDVERCCYSEAQNGWACITKGSLSYNYWSW